jgi:orotate phosphoribosyltransferase
MDTAAYRSDLAGLLRTRSLETGSFTLASGKAANFYIDARRTTMSGSGLRLIGPLGLSLIREAGWSPTFVGGLTLGADPVAYAVSLASLESPPSVDAFTVRKEAKHHGAKRQIEGCFAAGSPVVIIEDVVTTGQSALKAVEVVSDAGGVILGILALVDREEGGRQAIEDRGHQLRCMVTLTDLGLPQDLRRDQSRA